MPFLFALLLSASMPAMPASAASVSAAPGLVATALPRKGRVRYAMSRGEKGFVFGQSVHSWSHDGQSYTLQSVSETTGIAAVIKPARVVQVSRGRLVATGLQPQEFRHERVAGLDTAKFDWPRRLLAYEGREEPLPADTQDMLSMYYQLVLLMPAKTLEMPIATGRKLERYRFEVLGEEVLALKPGEQRTIHLLTKSGSDTIELWIAPAVRGLPVKIRFIDNKGEIFDQLADEIELKDTP
jgi:hypothetical protein